MHEIRVINLLQGDLVVEVKSTLLSRCTTRRGTLHGPDGAGSEPQAHFGNTAHALLRAVQRHCKRVEKDT